MKAKLVIFFKKKKKDVAQFNNATNIFLFCFLHLLKKSFCFFVKYNTVRYTDTEEWLSLARSPGLGPLCHLRPISLCLMKWMLLALSDSSGYCSTEVTKKPS